MTTTVLNYPLTDGKLQVKWIAYIYFLKLYAMNSAKI